MIALLHQIAECNVQAVEAPCLTQVSAKIFQSEEKKHEHKISI